MTIWNSGMR
jgi:hypothetical protein